MHNKNIGAAKYFNKLFNKVSAVQNDKIIVITPPRIANKVLYASAI